VAGHTQQIQHVRQRHSTYYVAPLFVAYPPTAVLSRPTLPHRATSHPHTLVKSFNDACAVVMPFAYAHPPAAFLIPSRPTPPHSTPQGYFTTSTAVVTFLQEHCTALHLHTPPHTPSTTLTHLLCPLLNVLTYRCCIVPSRPTRRGTSHPQQQWSLSCRSCRGRGSLPCQVSSPPWPNPSPSQHRPHPQQQQQHALQQ
jgi:hypothetical protein